MTRRLTRRLLALGLAVAMATPAGATFTTYNENLPGGPSVVYGTDAVIIANGVQGNGWLGGATLQAQGTPDMTVNLASGTAWSGQGGTPQVITIDANATVAISAADAEYPRLDLISISFSSTTAVVTTGTPGPFPMLPNLPVTNEIPNIALWVVIVPAGTTAITTELLMDKRMTPVKDWTLNTADVVDNNVSTTKHGFAPKAPNDALTYLDGTGAYSQAALKTGAVVQGSLLVTAGSAPSTPAAGKASIYVGSTTKNISIKDDAGVIKHGVKDLVTSGSLFVTGVQGDGTWETAQPAFSNLSGSIATGQIPNDIVTYAQMQNVSAASKLLGRGDSGSGDVQEITLGTGLTMTGTTLAASASSNVETWGVVTSDVTHAQSNTTLSNVTGLSAAICTASTEVWLIEATLIWTAANITVDFKYGWTFPTGVTMLWGPISQASAANYFNPGGTATTLTDALLVQTDTYTHASGNMTSGLTLRGVVTCSSTSGTLQLQFAQVTSNASDITIKKGSLLIARKVIP